MQYERKESSGKTILHIYPSGDNIGRTVKEHYVFPNSQRKKSYGHFKSRIKKIVKSVNNSARKYPRSTQEHTDFDKYPYKTTCPNCLSYIKTEVYYYNTLGTHTVAASLSPVCMCMIPYCITKFKNAAHYCPRCNIYLGTKFGSAKKLFRCLQDIETQ